MPHEPSKALNALFLTRYGNLGASSRYRFMQYEETLRTADIQCHFSPLLGDEYLKQRYAGEKINRIAIGYSVFRRLFSIMRSRRYDVVVLQGEVLPYCPAFLERFLSLIKVPYVVDFDDAIFHYYDKNPKWVVRMLLGRKVSTVVRKAVCVVVGNEYLADYARRAGARQIEIVPTVVDIERYPAPLEYGSKIGFNIGWIGSPGSSRYLSSLAPALQTIGQDTDTSTRLTLVGAGNDFEINGIETELIDWSQDTEVQEIGRFSVGVMPLPDDAWARGKCGFKLIQYMACGVPVVASPVGANKEIVEHGVNGFLASTTEEWINSLTALRADSLLAKRMGARGRTKVEKRYALQVTGPVLADILKRAVEK